MVLQTARLLAIVGPTATGKTSAAIHLAQQFNGEVVSADSRYLYRGMDIGTAKPSMTERRGVPHYLTDILDPEDDYSLALYQRDAYQTIEEIQSRNKLPILAGGTPLYVNAVLEGWRIPEVPPHPRFRAEMEDRAHHEGKETLHQHLQEIDPVAAERIPVNNVRRVIRALEIHNATGQRMSDLEGKNPPSYDVLKVGLTMSREALFDVIDRRVDQLLEQGFADEVRTLVNRGVSEEAHAFSAIGYREMLRYIRGEIDQGEAAEQIKSATHNYARHQSTWLRRMRNVHWFDAESPNVHAEIQVAVEKWLTDETTLGTPDVD